MTSFRYPDSAIAPARSQFAVTKSDATVLDPIKALYIGTSGDLVVRPRDQTTPADVTFKNVAAGTIIDIDVAQVRAATTAADIVALA